jgi:thioesterase domain-containing protein
MSETIPPKGPVPVTDAAAELEAIWRTEIPPAAAMRITVVALDRAGIIVSAGLEANRNLHGTAFAGSLFSVAALAGWGMTWYALRERAVDASIVLAKSRIRYLRAVTETIVCRCVFDWMAHESRLETLVAEGKGTFPLSATIRSAGGRAVVFEGDYAVRLARSVS